MGLHLPLLNRLLATEPDFLARLEAVITPRRTFGTFKALADTYAPTLAACHTRGPVLHRLLSQPWPGDDGTQEIRFERNYLATGAAVAILGGSLQVPVWSAAHLDNISFLTGIYQKGGYPLTPFCQSRQTPGARPAVALAMDEPYAAARICARGTLKTTPGPANAIEPNHFFETDAVELPLATRVCYATDAVWDQASDIIYGAIDNAACCTALVLACLAVRSYQPRVMVVFPDEEEGVVDVGPQTFARATLRLIQRTPPEQIPDLVVVSDIQDLDFDPHVDPRAPDAFGHGASMEAFTSRTRGAVTPPCLLLALRKLVGELSHVGIKVRETGRYLNRSDDVSLVMATPNVAHIGCPGAFTHFQEVPRTHVADIMHLAKALATLWMVAQDSEWRALFT